MVGGAAFFVGFNGEIFDYR